MDGLIASDGGATPRRRCMPQGCPQRPYRRMSPLNQFGICVYQRTMDDFSGRRKFAGDSTSPFRRVSESDLSARWWDFGMQNVSERRI